MKLTNDRYLITLQAGGTEYYYRQGRGWAKRSTRGRTFPATAEQVLNHLLPALAGVKSGVGVRVQHRDLAADAGARLDRLREPPVAGLRPTTPGRSGRTRPA